MNGSLKKKTTLLRSDRILTFRFFVFSEICKRAFSHAKTYRTHILIHTGEKKYPCSICDKRFTHSNSHKRHMMTHSGERPFSCSICDKKFSQSSSLAGHMSRHAAKQKAMEEANTEYWYSSIKKKQYILNKISTFVFHWFISYIHCYI